MTGSEHWMAVLRLVLCMAVAQGISLALHLDRPYLVMLTVAQIMKPELGSVFARAVQRGTGTFIGVGVGSLSILLIPAACGRSSRCSSSRPRIPIVMPRNYGLYAVISTPLAVMLVEMHAGVQAGLVESRLLDTVLGCAIVLVLGYAIWPSTWRAPQRLGGSVAGLCRALAEYVRVALGPTATEPSGDAGAVPSRTDARRATYRSISNLRADAARALAEPPPVSSAAAAWMPAIGALERVTDAATAAATTAEASGARIDRKDVAEVEAALTDLADSIDSARPPGADPVPAAGALAQVAR